MQRLSSNQFTLTLYLLLPIILSLACADLGTEPDPFSGITETDSSGPLPIGKVDPDDWKQIPLCVPPDSVYSFSRCASVVAAYPNPASGACSFRFALPVTDSVVITLNDRPTRVTKLVLARRLVAGMHNITVDLAGLEPGIYRLYFSVVRLPSVWTTYGDIQVMK